MNPPLTPHLSDYSKWWLPVDLSVHGADVDRLILVLHIFMAVLFIGWGIFFIYCLWRFSAKNNPKAHYTAVGGGISKVIEIAVIVIEAVLLVSFSMPVWARVKNERPRDEDAAVVKIYAKQFEWYFHYAGADGKFGKLDPKLIENDAVTPDAALGLDRSGDGKDDLLLTNKFIFPVGKKVVAYMTSRDVIHSFKVPVMRFTQDAVPGVVIPIWFETKADASPGVYDISCAQLCGVQHTSMRALAQIVTQAEYQNFLADPKKWQADHPIAGTIKD